MKKRITKLLFLIIISASISIVFNTILININNSNSNLLLIHETKGVNYVEDMSEYFQDKDNTCGPASIKFLLSRYGMDYSESELLKYMHIDENGSNALQLSECFNKLGFNCSGLRTDYEGLLGQQKPLIAFVNGNHYVVVTSTGEKELVLFDPLPNMGYTIYKKDEFLNIWDGIVLTVRPQPLTLTGQ